MKIQQSLFFIGAIIFILASIDLAHGRIPINYNMPKVDSMIKQFVGGRGCGIHTEITRVYDSPTLDLTGRSCVAVFKVPGPGPT